MPIQILLIEDNRPDGELVRVALRRQSLDFTLHEITNATEAAAYIERMGSAADAPLPDVVLMDLNLPQGDGLDLLQQIRNLPDGVTTPVIVMTSSESPTDRARATEMGNTRYFRKPSDLDAFLRIGALVRELLEVRQSG